MLWAPRLLACSCCRRRRKRRVAANRGYTRTAQSRTPRKPCAAFRARRPTGPFCRTMSICRPIFRDPALGERKVPVVLHPLREMLLVLNLTIAVIWFGWFGFRRSRWRTLNLKGRRRPGSEQQNDCCAESEPEWKMRFHKCRAKCGGESPATQTEPNETRPKRGEDVAAAPVFPRKSLPIKSTSRTGY